MTTWDTMTDREKDALLATEVCGWHSRITPDVATYALLGSFYAVPPGVVLTIGSGYERIPPYTTDRNAFAEVEAALERRGADVRNRYVEAIIELISFEGESPHAVGYFRMITAPLDIRCRAALKAVGVDV